MKYCRFLLDNEPHYGVVEDCAGEPCIVDLARGPAEDLAFQVAHGNDAPFSFRFHITPLSTAELLPPVTPSKIVCVGRNYRDHAKELGNEVPTEPLLFYKPPSSLLKPGGIVRMPAASSRVDFEGELALVIGKRVTKLPEGADWRAVIRGYTLANDVTARDLQKKDGQWTRAKGFDTFCPVGPWIETDVDLDNMQTIVKVNGIESNRFRTNDMIFGIKPFIVELTKYFTLWPGDVIWMGTDGASPDLKAGDVVEIEITGIGTLRNRFVAETAPEGSRA